MMRTDVTIDRKFREVVKLPATTERGESIVTIQAGTFVYLKGERECYRVLGRLVPKGLERTPYIVAVKWSRFGGAGERWFELHQIEDAFPHEGAQLFGDKAKWFWGEGFLQTHIDDARNCFNLLVQDMRKGE